MKDFTENEQYKDSSWFTALLLREEDSLYVDAALSERLNPLGIKPKIWTSSITFLIMLAIGIGIGSVAELVQATRPAVVQQTQTLKDQVIALQAKVNAAANRNKKLQSDIEQLREYILPTDNRLLNKSFAAAARMGGFTTVRGEGLQIEFQERSGATGSDLVLDVDLVNTLNGLWEAGASAIAVNGHRITSTTAIRNAGSAILVDFEPLEKPILISAIGGPKLADKFFTTDAYFWLKDMSDNYPIVVNYQQNEKMKLVADTIPSLTFAERISE